uniref:Uncharacterized protein n=1 Tax=Moniliophthora roreri TaxID=221103 RepID=A0A0W0FQ78_MONRR
MGTGYYLFNF